MKEILLAIPFIVLLGSCSENSIRKVENNGGEELSQWNYPDSLDAVKAAPDSHEILLENDEVRVLRVTIEPGVKEPMHTHKWKSIMYVEKPARIKYYNEENVVIRESPEEGYDYSPRPPSWMDPEILHSVENIDTTLFSALRIELKN